MCCQIDFHIAISLMAKYLITSEKKYDIKGKVGKFSKNGNFPFSMYIQPYVLFLMIFLLTSCYLGMYYLHSQLLFY